MIDKNKKEYILLQLLLAKDQNAWKKLFEDYSRNLSSICSRYLTSQDDIRDVLQESFIIIFNSINSFEYRGEGSLKAWMTRITVNESLKVIKNITGDPKLVQLDDLPDIYDDGYIALPKLSQDAILEVVRSLPPGYRTVFNLFVFEKKTHREIAGLLGIAEDSSASQFYRAKKMVAKKLKELEQLNAVSNGR